MPKNVEQLGLKKIDTESEVVPGRQYLLESHQGRAFVMIGIEKGTGSKPDDVFCDAQEDWYSCKFDYPLAVYEILHAYDAREVEKCIDDHFLERRADRTSVRPSHSDNGT